MTDLLKEIKEKRVETLKLADVQPEEIGATTHCSAKAWGWIR